MWQLALWGLAGGAANCGVAFLAASNHCKGWPWRRPTGPGGGVYCAAVLVHMGLGTLVAAVMADAHLIDNSFVAFGAGAAAVSLVKKAMQIALAAVPSAGDDGDTPERSTQDGERGSE